MAGRLHKQGLDFFSFDIDFDEDERIEDLQEEYPDSGPMFFIRLLCFIYKRSNYIEWTKTIRRQFIKKHGYSNEDVTKYLEACIAKGLFDRPLFEKYGVITSASIQERYLGSTWRREMVIYVQEYLLINLGSYKKIAHTVEVYTRDGEFIKKYTKHSADKNYTRKKSKQKDIAPERQKPSAGLSPSREEDQPSFKTVTQKQIMDFIKVPYDDRDEEFRTTYTKEEYDAYAQLNKKIDARFDNIRVSTLQLTFFDYVQLIEETAPTESELNEALKKMSGLGVKMNMQIYSRLDECISMIRKPFKRPEPNVAPIPDIDHVEYFRNSTLEKDVLDFFGFNQIAHPEKLKLIVQFNTALNNSERIEQFTDQFKHYKQLKELTGYKHSFDKFLGKQSERFEDGQWNAENWSLKLNEENEKRKQKTNHNNGRRKENRTGATPEQGYGNI